MQVRSAAESAAKFKTRAGAASEDYRKGVEGAGGRWQAGAEAGEAAFEAGVQESIANKRFGKGVRKAGAAKYQRNAVALGPSRFQAGVANAEQTYAASVQPFISALGSAPLTPRGARGSASNMQRVQQVADLMRKVRMEQLS